MDIKEKVELIKRNTQEIISEEELKGLLETKKTPSVYLGTAITGRPHVGYFLWVMKLADFLKTGFKVKVLFADLHGALDNCPWDLLEKRTKYYEKVIPAMFKSVGANIENFEMVKGSTFQLRHDYMLDTLKMASFVTTKDCTKAASDVVKFGEHPKLSGLIYPIMQALDEVYLEVDVQYGGLDQRKILVFARENLPKLGYKPRIEVMTPMIPALNRGGKMSASVEGSKIDLLDNEKTVKEKINKAYCPEGKTEENGVLAFLKYIVFTLKKDAGELFKIERPEKFGGNVEYEDYTSLEKDYQDKKIHPMDLKNALANEINKLLEPIREAMKDKENLVKEAYSE